MLARIFVVEGLHVNFFIINEEYRDDWKVLDNYKAINELQEFIDKYPESSKIDTCNILIDQLTDKLSKKAFENAKQYFITENYKAAIKALDNVIIDFPSLRNREEAHFLIIKSTILI